MPWWRKTEKRAGQTSVVVDALARAAAGTDAGIGDVGAVETAATHLSRAFAGIRVEGADAVTPEVMSSIARDLVRVGRSLHVIENDGTLVLRRASSWEIQGGRDRAEWRIRAVVPGPTTTATITTTWAGVVACSAGRATSSPARAH